MLQREIVLRRFDREPVEIVCLAIPAAAPALVAGPGTAITSHTDGETQVYRVVLPDGYAVRPVDWRRFAMDEARLRELLAQCVRDNLGEALFEPWSDAWRERAVAKLELALQDLGSMFEVLRVLVEPGGVHGERQVVVEARDVQRRVFSVGLVLGEP
jgi:hypothetical protein